MSESTELQTSVDRLTATIDKLRDELVRKDVYDANERARDAALATLRDDNIDLKVRIEKAEERRAADRRLAIFSVLVPLALIVLQVYVAARTGGA